ncbi:MAG TPA: transposase [Candidatus Paceibacterota bacterium]
MSSLYPFIFRAACAISPISSNKQQWIIHEERAVRCLEKDIHECLTYYRFAKSLWKKIRTTNIIERSFREIRRRTRPMSVALPPKFTERLFVGLTKSLNNNWEQAPLKFTH